MSATSTATAPLPRRLASLVRIEHTVFALPFAYVGTFLAAGDWPGLAEILWITVAMIGFNQNWHVEEERPIGSGEDYGAGAPPDSGATQPA